MGRWVRLSLLIVTAATLPSPAAAQGVFRENFEGATPSFEPLAADTQFQTRCHARVQTGAHSGQTAEFIEIAAGAGTYVHYAMPLGPAAIIPDLQPSVWVKSPRGGVQLLAHVVLPRARHPQTGDPISLLVRGDVYRQANGWQRLTITNLPQLVEREARLLRFEQQAHIDIGEAYLDQVVVNVLAAPGLNRVWIDDLEVPGLVEPARFGAVQPAQYNGPPTVATTPGVPNTRTSAHRQVSRAGMQLTVDGKPFFARAVEYQGEPLAMLRRLGFNAVKLPATPNAPLLAEAVAADMWLICPPPTPQSNGQSLSVPTLGPEFEPVLVWDLGENLTGGEFDRLAQWAEMVRKADKHLSRPLMCDALTELRVYSRHVDLLRPYRRPLGSSLELVDYLTWLRERPRLARPGTPFWTTIQTHPAWSTSEQIRLLGGEAAVPRTVPEEQIRLLTYTALAAGGRGLIFESAGPLDRDDPATKSRRAILELLNIELELIEPWISSGTLVTTLSSPDGEIRATLFQLQRSRLLIPIWTKRGAQYSTGQSAANSVSLVVPGIPDSNQVFELLPTSLRPIDHKRVAGGVRVTLPEFSLTSAVLLSQDPLVVTSASKTVGRVAERSAQLQLEVAIARVEQSQQLAAALTALRQDVHKAWLTAAEGKLQSAKTALAAKRWEEAYLESARSMRPIRVMERHYWDAAWQNAGSPTADPLLVTPHSFPSHWSFAARLATAQAGANRLAGGDCENRERMVASGWKHVQHTQAGLESSAELVPGTPHAGQFSLRMRVWPTDAESPPELVESPPIWITSGPVNVRAGELLRISGFVRVPAPVVGNIDGLMIIDSLGGPALAERVAVSAEWRPFTLYRVAARDDAATVTFALTGIGEAWIDDVTIEPMQNAAPLALRPRPDPRTAMQPGVIPAAPGMNYPVASQVPPGYAMPQYPPPNYPAYPTQNPTLPAPMSPAVPADAARTGRVTPFVPRPYLQ